MSTINKHRMEAEQLFLELLRAGLHQTPVSAILFSDVSDETWRGIVRLSNQQRVNALILDGIHNLPRTCRVPRKVIFDLVRKQAVIERRNNDLNREVAELNRLYRKNGFPFVLLKGQGNAIYYQQPEHRTPGDIDLYLYGNGSYKRANEWAKKMGYECTEEGVKHMAYTRGDVYVENHRHIAYFTNKRYNQPFWEEMDRAISEGRCEEITIEGERIQVLPIELNTLYVFQHLFHHFTTLGVSVRQFADWILMLKERGNEINRPRFEQLALRFGLLKPMRIFAHAAIRYLGADESIFPFDLLEGTFESERVMRDILEGGHFGFYQNPTTAKDGVWMGRWKRYVCCVKRTIELQQIAPSHFKPLPFDRLKNRVILTIESLYK